MQLEKIEISEEIFNYLVKGLEGGKFSDWMTGGVEVMVYPLEGGISLVHSWIDLFPKKWEVLVPKWAQDPEWPLEVWETEKFSVIKDILENLDTPVHIHYLPRDERGK